MKWLLILAAVFAFTASAADVAGTWKATMETPQGAMENTFVFKMDGANLTGSDVLLETPPTPVIDSASASDLTGRTAKLQAQINPKGS